MPLIGYMINGAAMRFSGDDYCYAGVLGKLGFWKTQWVSYAQPQAYNGNRYSLTFFSSLSGSFGPRMNGFLPALVIIIWMVGMVYGIRKITRAAGISINTLQIILITEIIIFFTLYTAPSLPQSLFWRSGMLPYLAPLVANTFLLALINPIRKSKAGLWSLALIGFLALLAGGFSEAATAIQLGYLSLVGAGILILVRNKARKNLLLQPVLVAWVASLLAIALLALSPSNATIINKASRPDFLYFLGITLKSAFSFTFESITSLPLPTAILFLFSSGLSWLVKDRTHRLLLMTWRNWLKLAAVIVLACIFLIIFSVAPSAYIQSAYPELRALFIPRFLMVLAILALGSITGMLVYDNLPIPMNRFQSFKVWMMILVIVLSLYPIYVSRNIFTNIPQYQRWASFWDARDREIRLLKQNQVMDIEVMKIDHIIPFVAELSEDAHFWYNVCAAEYYGVHTIHADLPGWDTP